MSTSAGSEAAWLRREEVETLEGDVALFGGDGEGARGRSVVVRFAAFKAVVTIGEIAYLPQMVQADHSAK